MDSVDRRQLLVLDFDWTVERARAAGAGAGANGKRSLATCVQVINCNSDTDVVENFAADETELHAMRARMSEAGKSDAWTKGMDAEMDLLHKVHDICSARCFTSAPISRTLSPTPYDRLICVPESRRASPSSRWKNF